jgi:hypothetical protein
MTVAVRPDSFWAYQLCLVVCGVLACAVGTAAQTQTAVLEGTVQDTSGGVIANAAVEVRDIQTNQRRAARTDSQGSFRFTEVPAGTYEVRATYDGFEPYVHAGVTLAIGQTARLVVPMCPAGVIQGLAVSAQPPLLDSRQTSVTTTIDTERIEELPVRSRNYLEFVLLAPGVTRPDTQTTPGVVSSTLPDSGFSFGGLRPRSNSLTIDGLDNNDEFTGSTRTELSLEFVREFQVVTNSWSVENGGASGGAINRRYEEWCQRAPRRRVPLWSVRHLQCTSQAGRDPRQDAVAETVSRRAGGRRPTRQRPHVLLRSR